MSDLLAQKAKSAQLAGLVDMPEAEYHKHPALSNSGMSYLLRSPSHYVASRNVPMEPTEAMKFGTAVHYGILEPQKFYSRYAAAPEGIDRRTKAGKDAYAACLEANPGKEILAADDFAKCDRIIIAVHSHATASKLLSNGRAEQSLFWTDAQSGVPLRSRLDFLRNDGLVVDLKTTRSASASEFKRSIGSYGYHRQGAMYLRGSEAVALSSQGAFLFVAVEVEEPFGIGVFALDDYAVAAGNQEIDRACAIFAECLRTDAWPGYPEEVQTISVPNWVNSNG